MGKIKALLLESQETRSQNEALALEVQALQAKLKGAYARIAELENAAIARTRGG